MRNASTRFDLGGEPVHNSFVFSMLQLKYQELQAESSIFILLDEFQELGKQAQFSHCWLSLAVQDLVLLSSKHGG